MLAPAWAGTRAQVEVPPRVREQVQAPVRVTAVVVEARGRVLSGTLRARALVPGSELELGPAAVRAQAAATRLALPVQVGTHSGGGVEDSPDGQYCFGAGG